MRNDSAHHGTSGWQANVIAVAVCGAAFVLLLQLYGNSTLGYIKSASLFHWWTSQWLDPRAESEHGWLILAMSGWLFWRNLRIADSGSEVPDRPNPAYPQSEIHDPKSAAVAMIAGLFLHAAGFAAQQARLSILALLLFVWGVLRMAGGRRWGDAAMFPLAFMLFAIPINVLDSAGFWLRMWVIEASAWLAHGAGIDVMRSGTQLVAPDGRYNYDVAAACSGVRSLTALAALSLLVGYLSFHSWWRRTLVFLLCFPLVYLGNVARIASIIFAAQAGGSKWGDRAHDIMGYGVFVIVLGGVLGATTLIQRWWPEAAEDRQRRTEGERETGTPPRTPARPAPSLPSLQSTRFRFSAFTVSVLIAGIAAGEMGFLHHLANSPERGEAGVILAADGLNPVELPAYIGIEWTGQPAPVTSVERDILPPDTGFSRKSYFSHRDPNKRVFLSIVLSGRDRTSIHRPELCLVGQGWTIDAETRRQFRFPGQPGAAGSFPVTLLEIRREVRRQGSVVLVPELAAYWFVDSDTVVATHWSRIARDAWNRLTRARADRWAYVLVQTNASDGKAAALARMQQVLDGTLPAFQRPETANR